MKKFAILLLALLMFCASCAASACGTYILIPDSDTRLLFEEEVRSYCIDTLGYVLCEIVARHGYHFDHEGKYADHFLELCYVDPHDSGFPYEEAPDEVSNEEIITGLSDIERQNINLILRVMTEKIESNDISGYYEDWCCEERTDSWNLFDEIDKGAAVNFPRGLNLPVYSGPGEHYLRADGGLAAVNTGKNIYGYGFDGDWLLIAYYDDWETDQTRVGYVHQDAFGRDLNPTVCKIGELDEYERSFCSEHTILFDQLKFGSETLTLPAGVTLTDDPLGKCTPLTRLSKGDTVTVLFAYPPKLTPDNFDEETTFFGNYERLIYDIFDGYQWFYVETHEPTPARGFISCTTLYLEPDYEPKGFNIFAEYYQASYDSYAVEDEFDAQSLANAEKIYAELLEAEPSAENEMEHALWEALCQSSETHIQRVIHEIASGE